MDELAIVAWGSSSVRRGRIVLVGLLAFLVASCAEPPPKPAPPPPAVVASIAPMVVDAAVPPPPSRKAGPSLFVGRHQTWVVLASGKVATWGRSSGRRGEVEGKVLVEPKLADVIGVRAAGQRDYNAFEDDLCAMKTAGECKPGLETTKPSGLESARLFDSDGASTCGVLPDGTLRCTGPVAEPLETYGRGELLSVSRDFGRLPDAIEISVGDGHACALRKAGEVVCWGHIGHGLLGDGQTFLRDRAPVVGVTDAKAVALERIGGDSGCAIRRDGHVACWGSNGRGRLGVSRDVLRGRATAADVPGIERAEKFAADGRCVIRTDSKIQCWGIVAAYHEGIDARPDPSPYFVGPEDAVDAAWVSGSGVCVVRKTGAVECFGKKKTTLSRSSGALAIASNSSTVDSLTCVLLGGGRVRCWVGETVEAFTRSVPKDSVEVDALALERYGSPHEAITTVRTASGLLLQQVGDGRRQLEDFPKPTPRGLLVSGKLEEYRRDIARMARGSAGYVTVDKHGHVSGSEGEEVEGIEDAIDIADNDHATCVVRRGGTVECWGEELGAGMGRGKAAYVDVPVKVPLPEPVLL